MHTCISSHGLKRSWRSCPRRVNAGNKKHTQHAASTKTECDYLNGWIKKRSHTQKSHPKVVNPRDIAGERKKKKKKKDTRYLFDVFYIPLSGVALTFEKLRIANVQHGKNCVSSPAAKTTISTDLPKICPGHDRAGLQTAHRPFWLRHHQYVGTSIPSLGWDGEGRGEGAVEI